MGRYLFLLGLIFSGANAEEVIYEDDFESGSLNPAYWRTSSEGEGGFVKVATDAQGVSAPRRGSYAVVMGKEEDGGQVTNHLDLVLDLSGHRQVELSFWIRDREDDTSPLEGISFSDDNGETFTKVGNFDPSRWVDRYGRLPHLDVDELAKKGRLSLTGQFVIRFTHVCKDNLINDYCCNQIDGLFIDDVKVTSSDIQYAELPFEEDFEGKLGPWWREATQATLGDIPDHKIHLHDFIETISDLYGTSVPLDGFKSLGFGRYGSEDEVLSRHAMDLHLDLEGEEEVYLSFLVGGWEVTHAGDGIFLSDDSGKHFYQTFNFNGSRWDQSGVGEFPPLNLTERAKKLGLEMTDTFVIRFQHELDADSFYRCCTEQQLLLLDNIVVRSIPKVYARPPLQEGFEGKLGPHWRSEFPLDLDDAKYVRPSTIARPMDYVQGVSAAHAGFRGLVFGKDFEGRETTNAINLYLDLSDANQVEMTFWHRSFEDEGHAQDGIFFSNDGGTSFCKVWDFNLAGAGTDWSEVSLDIQSLASACGLDLTNRFVIRFQQHDDSDFTRRYSSDDIDGWMIDTLSITAQSASQRSLKSVVPWVVDNPDFQSRLSIYNDGGVTARTRLIGLGQEGVEESVEITIAPKSLYAIDAGDLFPGKNGYSLFVEGDVDTLYTSFLTVNVEARSGGSSPSQTVALSRDQLETNLLFGYVPGAWTSAIVLVAPEVSAGSTNVRLELYGTGGERLETTTVRLSGRRPFAQLVSSLFSVAIPPDASLKAYSEPGVLLTGTTFVFNQLGQPSMTVPFPRGQ